MQINFKEIRSNRINGEPLRFGDPEQIRVVKAYNAIMAGEKPVGFVDWRFGRTVGRRDTIAIGFKLNECDTYQAFCFCTCGARIIHHYHYQPAPLHMESLNNAYSSMKEFDCNRCNQEFVYDEDCFEYYVKTPMSEEICNLR
jgi:hypothetical protein